MTDSSDPALTVRPADSIVNGDDRIAWSVQAAPISKEETDIIDVVLEGGPVTLPAELRSQRVPLAENKIKVCHYGGYEHFQRDPAEIADGVPVVFRWTGRTRIAE